MPQVDLTLAWRLVRGHFLVGLRFFFRVLGLGHGLFRVCSGQVGLGIILGWFKTCFRLIECLDRDSEVKGWFRVSFSFA